MGAPHGAAVAADAAGGDGALKEDDAPEQPDAGVCDPAADGAGRADSLQQHAAGAGADVVCDWLHPARWCGGGSRLRLRGGHGGVLRRAAGWRGVCGIGVQRVPQQYRRTRAEPMLGCCSLRARKPARARKPSGSAAKGRITAVERGSTPHSYFADTRHTTSPTSSATSSAPSASIAMPTGAPIRVSSFEVKPLTTVCGRPVGLPS